MTEIAASLAGQRSTEYIPSIAADAKRARRARVVSRRDLHLSGGHPSYCHSDKVPPIQKFYLFQVRIVNHFKRPDDHSSKFKIARGKNAAVFRFWHTICFYPSPHGAAAIAILQPFPCRIIAFMQSGKNRPADLRLDNYLKLNT